MSIPEEEEERATFAKKPAGEVAWTFHRRPDLPFDGAVPRRFLKPFCGEHFSRAHRKNRTGGGGTSRPKVHAVTSYGLILFHVHQEDGEPRFLLYQRRDSFQYLEFIRGLWRSEAKLPELFAGMTREERQRLHEFTFVELWNDLWVDHTCYSFKKGFARAKHKYDSLRQEEDKIKFYLDSTTSTVNAPPWGFPKGRKHSTEEYIECAVREFVEETKIPSETFRVWEHLLPRVETVKGFDDKVYKAHYFIANAKTMHVPPRVSTPQCVRASTISEEACDVRWVTYAEAWALLDAKKRKILSNVLEVIRHKLSQNEDSE